MAASDAALANGASMNMSGFSQLGNKLMIVAAIAAIIAMMVVFWLWSQQPDYRVLYSNYTDKDGGAIVAELEKMNVPYKFAEGGNAILVPASQVHQARLKLAADGLPKGGNAGFELLENQKFGVSQFVEQVNFQRALEGELERSVQSISAVEGAKIHLAIPKSTVFVREQQKPTASVLLNLRAGRSLDPQQVGAIVHLVASSVPDLPASNVTVVDQNGALLSDTTKKTGNNLDATQIKYIEDMQQSITKRVESIIAPIVGEKNVRAEASVEVDFASVEQAAETYKPNQKPEETAIRSLQNSESQTANGSGTASGVPGALSNQPPGTATAPITSPAPAAGATGATAAAPATPINSQKNTTTNFEVDKTVRYTQQPMGGIKRINVAVVVNNMQVIDPKGKVTYRPLTAAEKTQINDLAMQAMGFNKERGDQLTVVNSSFAENPVEKIADVPMWKNPEVIEYVKDALRFLVGMIVLMMIYKRALKPMLNKLTAPPTQLLPAPNKAEQQDAVVSLGNQPAGSMPPAYEQNLLAAKQMAKDNPRIVASVVSNWTNGNESKA